MSVDFFTTSCKEKPRKENYFGILDDHNELPAYTVIDDEKEWIAKVINKNNKEICFIAIDNCVKVYKQNDASSKESICDGMLVFENGIYLVELKNRAVGGWIPKAIEQLENTIRLLKENHSLEEFQYKKAYACNKKHPRFAVMESENRRKFFRNTGFRIDAQREVKIK